MSTAVYVVVWEDRHTDVEVTLFSELQPAIDWVESFPRIQQAREIGDVEEEQIDGWDYYIVYSCEGDSVRIEKKVIDAKT